MDVIPTVGTGVVNVLVNVVMDTLVVEWVENCVDVLPLLVIVVTAVVTIPMLELVDVSVVVPVENCEEVLSAAALHPQRVSGSDPTNNQYETDLALELEVVLGADVSLEVAARLPAVLWAVFVPSPPLLELSVDPELLELLLAPFPDPPLPLLFPGVTDVDGEGASEVEGDVTVLGADGEVVSGDGGCALG